MSKHPFLALLVLFLLTPFLAAQQAVEENDDDAANLRIGEFFLNRATPTFFEKDSSGIMMLALAGAPDATVEKIREELGITEEQRDRVNEFMQAAKPENFEETQKVIEGMFQNLAKNSKYVPSEEELTAFDSLRDYMFDTTNACATEVFSAEQIQRADGMILALSGGLESPLFNERHMAALNMTEEQKKQFAQINEELKPERDKMIAGISATLLEKVKSKSADFGFKDLVGMLSKFKAYTKELKKRRMAVLTASQVSKVKTMSQLPKALSIANLLPQWAPDADSWKPGDPLPEGFVPENKESRPFPRAEKE
jgi:Spy/CpxP family protein refolding chaperone